LQYDVENKVVLVCPHDTTCAGLLFAIPRGHCSLACDMMKKLNYCCLLIAIRQKNTIIVVIAMLVARILTIRHKKYWCRRFLQYDKNMLLQAMAQMPNGCI
jgi:hypothetical protein